MKWKAVKIMPKISPRTMIIILAVVLLLSAPIFIGMMIPSFAYLLGTVGMPAFSGVQQFVGGLNKFNTLCVPFFTLASTIMGRGEIGPRLVKFSRSMVGHLPGGSALTTILCCVIIGAISGAAYSGIFIIGALMYEELKRNGYDDGFSTGLIITSSPIGMLIPPSIMFVVFAMNTDTSILKLFLSGTVSGLIMAIMYGIYSVRYAKKHNLKPTPKATGRELWQATKDAKWALGLPIVMIGGMYSGIFSPTEAAGASAIYAIAVEMLVYKGMRFKELFKIVVEAAKTSASIYLLLGAGQLLGYTMTLAKLPQAFEQLVNFSSPAMVLIMINIIFLIAGCFVNGSSALVVLVPLVMTLARRAGIDMVHLGNILVVNLSIGMYTPPFGLCLFVGSKTLNVSFSKCVKGVLPFMVISLIVLAIITAFPILSTGLPDLLYPAY